MNDDNTPKTDDPSWLVSAAGWLGEALNNSAKTVAETTSSATTEVENAIKAFWTNLTK